MSSRNCKFPTPARSRNGLSAQYFRKVLGKEVKMDKFWTVRDGVVGTAHESRDGRIVDFRPGWVVVAQERDEKIEVRPAKGVRAEPLTLPIGPGSSEKVVVRKDYPHPGQQEVQTIFRTRFMGAEIVAKTGGKYEWYDPRAEAAARAEQVARDAEYRASRKREVEFIRAFPKEKFFEKATRREVGRLRSGRLNAFHFVFRVLEDEGKAGLGRIDAMAFYNAVVEMQNTGVLEDIRKEILERDDALREERKRQWLAKAGQGGE